MAAKLLHVPLSDVFTTNGYFYVDEESGRGFLIDPAAEAETLLGIIRKNGWTIEKMLITHGHFDHTGAVQFLHEQLGIPYYIHKDGAAYLSDARLNLSAFCGRNVILTDARYLSDGDVVSLSGGQGIRLTVLHTPGHTPDSVIYYDEARGAAFVGDTIFRGAIGSTQYPGGNARDLQRSITEVVFALPEKTRLYSGHSAATTVGAERKRFL